MYLPTMSPCLGDVAVTVCVLIQPKPAVPESVTVLGEPKLGLETALGAVTPLWVAPLASPVPE